MAAQKAMKVAISMTIEFDPESWTANYGMDDRREIREDVRSYVQHGLQAQLEGSGIEGVRVVLK
jgi:hypothetical protein